MRMNRRNLLKSAGAAAAACALPAAFLPAAGDDAPPLPPPLTPEAFRERQAKLRREARARGLDAVFVTPSTNLAYCANLAIGRSERLTALVLFADGPAVLLTPSFEEGNHRKTAVVDDVRTWQEDEDPIALAGKLLSSRKSLGMEGTTNYATATALSAATSARIEDATPVFDTLRMIKSPDEQAFIRDAAKRTNLAIERTHKRLRAGMSEGEVERMLEEEFSKQGTRGGGLVQFGPSAAFPHGAPAERRLARGDTVLIDCGCRTRGYSSDITRTVSFGPPSDEFRKVYAIVDRAQMAGIEALKAGAADAGYGKYFTHRLGHGLGMDGHEQPYLVRGNRKPLAAGNVETIEPGIYIPDRFGVRIEDDYAVESAGARSLSVRPGEMVVLQA
jgi:Xaa-Pro dipeptidase